MLHPRTIKEAAAYIKDQDPKTALTETAIRTLVRSGALPSAKVGRKYLVTIEAIDAYLAGAENGNKNAEK